MRKKWYEVRLVNTRMGKADVIAKVNGERLARIICHELEKIYKVENGFTVTVVY